MLRRFCWYFLVKKAIESFLFGCWLMPDLLVKEMEAIIVDKPREFKIDPRI